jgi:predicted ester cyclase
MTDEGITKRPSAAARRLDAAQRNFAPTAGDDMSDGEQKQKAISRSGAAAAGDAILQVERRDFVDLVPEDRPRVQSMEGFDPCYTDIVDYIVRCTHKIWDERDVGLIYSHYTSNSVVYYTNHAVYDRESIVHDTMARLTAFPERRGQATQVIWRGDDKKGFYTSHYVTGAGRHTQPGRYGPPTRRSFNTRTVADCMVYRNRIYREWIVTDSMGVLRQLGIDPHPVAEKMAAEQFAKGLTTTDIGENFRMMGQYPPELDAYAAPAHNDIEAWTLQWMHEVFNRRMFGTIRKVYAPNAQYHGPLMRELYSSAAVMHQVLAFVAMIPDMAHQVHHVCSVESEEGGHKVAVRWTAEGHHLGWGSLGEPTGHRLFVLGVSHFHVIDGRIVDEWTVYDELALLAQLKLAGMMTRAG